MFHSQEFHGSSMFPAFLSSVCSKQILGFDMLPNLFTRSNCCIDVHDG